MLFTYIISGIIKRLKVFKLAFILLTCTYTLKAEVILPKLISDGMVLQRDAKLRVWGWANKGEAVTFTFKNKKYRTVTSVDGKWAFNLPALKAGGPYAMEFQGTNKITVKDVLVGDVWFCAGQSNMVIPMERVKERYPEEIESANYPQIRTFVVAAASDIKEAHTDLPGGKWLTATRENIMSFGAVSYFFARSIHKNNRVPIGIINSSVGGTPAQAWIGEEGIKEIPAYNNRLAEIRKIMTDDPDGKNRAVAPPVKPVVLETADVKAWSNPGYDAGTWHPFWLPGYWEDQGVKDLNGVVYFRKVIEIPASIAGKPAKLFLGRIIDADEAFVNGTLVGNISYQYPPRRYIIPTGLLKPGKNVIVIKITNNSGKGGFVPDKPYYLESGNEQIDLRGDWQYRVTQVFPPETGAQANTGFSAQDEPTGLFNTMVAPLTAYRIKGFVWYQGEANTNKPGEYNLLLTTLIKNWRGWWKDEKLSFIYAQLPNFMEVQYLPSESKWAELREAQLKALAVKNTGMAVGIDLGEWNDIHPLNKKDLGERLALVAENLAYQNLSVVASGPLFQSATIHGSQIEITFTNTGSGLMAKGGNKLAQFAIAGVDKKFVWANAVITGDKVVVSTDEIPSPLYVRYAWADNPEGANLYNKEGLPASPFRTDIPTRD